MAYLYDLSLSMLGPEGLRGCGAADSHKAGWLTVQSRSDKFTAGCRSTWTRDYKLQDLIVGWSLILGHGKLFIGLFILLQLCYSFTAVCLSSERTQTELQHRLIWILTVACRTERQRRAGLFNSPAIS